MVHDDVVELIPALQLFARTLHRGASDAEDLVQETLTKAISNIAQFEEGTRLKSWMFTIMRNTFNTRYHKRQREVVGLTPEMLTLQSCPAEQEWTVESKQVFHALMRLPGDYREVIVLIVIMGESYEDTAEIAGCPIGTVKSRLNRARNRLRHEIGGDPFA